MKVIAPRVPTPGPLESGRSTSRLPDELVAEQVSRVRLLSGVSLGVWTFGLIMNVFVFPRTVGAILPPSAIAVQVGFVAAALLIFLYLRFGKCGPHIKSNFGLWLMLFNAAAVTWVDLVANLPLAQQVGRPSWIAIVILATAMIVPSTPKKIFLASLGAASMGPFAAWLLHFGGGGLPLSAALAIYLPNYIWVVVATLPSAMFQRLGKRLREAQELGNYQLIELLGQGGMGEVWRARHRLLARHAAIKLVRPEVLGDGAQAEAKQALRRFEREAQATASLSSQHSIRLFDYGATDEGNFYYVMELLTGRDLESLIREFGPVPANRAMFLLRQVCHSLAEAHERGLVHRDIKPANIYVCRMGLDYDFVKVLDFGLVKFRDGTVLLDQTQSRVTADQTMMGTPSYMAPEVILGHGNVDRRADVYALGCVAYFMLTGHLVFEGGTRMQALVDHVHTPPIPPSQRAELPIPRELDELVLACLAKDPDQRPQDAAAVQRLLTTCTTCAGWSNARAQEWWQRHLPDLAGPLTVADAPLEPVGAR
jgi:serine/threonine-protein kinase